jgi:signal transduction histidine kinase
MILLLGFIVSFFIIVVILTLCGLALILALRGRRETDEE